MGKHNASHVLLCCSSGSASPIMVPSIGLISDLLDSPLLAINMSYCFQEYLDVHHYSLGSMPIAG